MGSLAGNHPALGNRLARNLYVHHVKKLDHEGGIRDKWLCPTLLSGIAVASTGETSLLTAITALSGRCAALAITTLTAIATSRVTYP